MDEVENNHLSEVFQTQKENCHTFSQVDSSFESSEVFQLEYPQKLGNSYGVTDRRDFQRKGDRTQVEMKRGGN